MINEIFGLHRHLYQSRECEHKHTMKMALTSIIFTVVISFAVLLMNFHLFHYIFLYANLLLYDAHAVKFWIKVIDR